MRILLFVLLGLLVCSIATAKKGKAKHKKAQAKSGGIASEKVEGTKAPKGKKAVGKDKGKAQQFVPPPPPPPPGTPGPPPPAPPPCDGGVWNPTTQLWDCPPPPPPDAPPPPPPEYPPPPPPPYPPPPPPPEVPPPPPPVPPPPPPPEAPPPPPPVYPPPPPPVKYGGKQGDEEGSGDDNESDDSVSAVKVDEKPKALTKGKKLKKKAGKKSRKTSRRHLKQAKRSKREVINGEEKRGTVLTHTINKISQSPNAKLLQHGKSHTTSTSHLKQGARKKRSEFEDAELSADYDEKRGTVLTHTINKISQTPNAKLLQHGKSHTTSTSHLKQDSKKRKRGFRKSGRIVALQKKGKVIQHTVAKVSQSPTAENAMHGSSHTVSTARATKTEGVQPTK